MLIQFSVKNFKSIKNEITLDMTATSSSELSEKLHSNFNGERILPIASIYGPNSSGKSNVLLAICALVNEIINPIYSTSQYQDNRLIKTVQIKPFEFDNKTITEPTEFEIIFDTAMNEYKYYLSIFKNEIISEQLDIKKFSTNRISNVFTRDNLEVKLGESYKSFKSKAPISNNLPYLSYLMIIYNTDEIIGDLLDFFTRKIAIYNYGDPRLELFIFRLNDKNDPDQKVKNLLLKMFREMDIDIANFDYVKDKQGLDIITDHKIGDKVFNLHFTEESSGTQKLFKILPLIIQSLIEGTTLIIDELDAKLHPSLLKYIINLYTDMTINKNKAQIIFTSHDLTTMNKETFRRDEIYFTVKDDEESSNLYSLAEFKVRKDARYDKQYLEGKYGADPYIQRIINWDEI